MQGTASYGQYQNHIAELNEARTIPIFQSELTRAIEAELRRSEVFFGVLDGSKGLQLPSWVLSYLERQPGSYKRLEQGEVVAITLDEEKRTPASPASRGSTTHLFPVIHDGVLYGAIGVVVSTEARQFAQECPEIVRQFAHDAGPVLSRLNEIESLRRENQQLKAAAERSSTLEKHLARVIDERNVLNALLQMRTHLHFNIAHELRTPLAAVRGYARMILDKRAGEISKTQRDYLTVITDNANRLIDLVSWMSYVAQLSVHHVKLSEFDLRDIWAECVKAHQPALLEKSVELVQRIPDEPFLIVGDRTKLAYVFKHLLATVVKFTNPGGNVVATFSHGREREVTVKISDNGGGIPPEMLTKIFDRSLNAIPMSSLQYADLNGINLTGVYDVVGMHGGRVFVNSRAGEGSTFLFTLPAVTFDGEERLGHEQAVHSGRR